ncbi:MAG: 3,4-dihydroxy-2-butanone-4-phosphate synthase, partial [Chloroflexi bacterium]|nr:3,4-dihydroxy-2-butanone-4-phosphate synthase [Chloroflexota bacterium]
MRLATVEEALADMAQGKFVILVDDEDRENEGDLAIAAEKCTPDAINFMATHGKGLICVAMEGKRLDELRVPLMVPDVDNTANLGTAFTVSVEAKQGTTTGISAFDRATTVQALVDPKTRAIDLLRPGHIFPLRARDGGVLVRAGQTEGVVDMARLAGLYPAGVICEIMNPDGSMARMPDLEAFAEKFHIAIVSVADLIQHRRRHEKLIERVAFERLEDVQRCGAGDFYCGGESRFLPAGRRYARERRTCRRAARSYGSMEECQPTLIGEPGEREGYAGTASG